MIPATTRLAELQQWGAAVTERNRRLRVRSGEMLTAARLMGEQALKARKGLNSQRLWIG